jgi:hypothetical protein
VSLYSTETKSSDAADSSASCQYADIYIICMGLSSFLFIYPNGKLSAIDAYFLGVSASTVTGLTT